MAVARCAWRRLVPGWLLGGLLGLAAWPALALDGGVTTALVPVPPLERPVTDQAGVLAEADAARIEGKLRAFRDRHGSQLAVLVVRTTRPETAFDYSLRVVEQWQLGGDKADNGLLLLLAVDDRKSWIQTGYGLEGAVPDALASRVLRETLAPRLRTGDFAGGIEATMDVLIQSIEHGAEAHVERPERKSRGAGAWLIALLVGLAAGLLVRALLGSLRGATIGGFAAMTVGTQLLGAALGGVLVVALVVFFVVLLWGRSGDYIDFGGGGGGFGGGGFGSGSGSGGWGGGGGDFGGGGAGGDW